MSDSTPTPEQPRTAAGRRLLALMYEDSGPYRSAPLLRSAVERAIRAIEAEAQARPEQDEAVRLAKSVLNDPNCWNTQGYALAEAVLIEGEWSAEELAEGLDGE